MVLDASAVVDLLSNSRDGSLIAKRIASEPVLNAPHLLDLELLSVFRRQRALGSITDQRAGEALRTFRFLPITRHSHLPLLDRIWALRHNFTAYDACYLALAEALGATLLTRDKALLTAPIRRGKVEVI